MTKVWSLRLDFVAKMASSYDVTSPCDLFHGLVAGASLIVCADLNEFFCVYEFLSSCGPHSYRYVYVIAWGRGQLRINFTSIFKVFTKLPESRSDEGNLENFENTSEINP